MYYVVHYVNIHSFFIYPYGWGGGKRPKDGQLVVPTQSSERYDMRKKTRNRTKKNRKKERKEDEEEKKVNAYK